jgi:hypothetical protein
MSSLRILEITLPLGVGPDKIIVDWEKNTSCEAPLYVAMEVTRPEHIATLLRFYEGNHDDAIRAAMRRYRKYRKQNRA